MTSDWPRPLVHWAIVAVDPDKQRAFYSQLFNWDISDGHFMAIEAGIGAPEAGPAGHIQAGSAPGVSLYFQVRDLRSSLDLAVQLGGKEIIAPFDLSNGQTLAAVEDPEGNFLMLVQQ
jgi:predicted enzyme related to lactoylglutathione lyase